MQHHTIRDGKLAVWQSGRRDRGLVFLHGFQNDHSAWSPLLARLDQDRYRFTSFDLLGCGASGRARSWQRCTIDEYAADLVALCDQLEIDRPAVVGHSLGAAIILRAALAHPGRFAAAVLVAPVSTTRLDFLPDEASFEALAHPGTTAGAGPRSLPRLPPDEDFRQLTGVLGSASAQHIEGAARSMRAFTRQAELAALDMPSIVICGDRDRHVPLRNHLATQQAIPRCRLQVYFDVGHVPFVETPDCCADDTERFLETIA